jgi:hypothetical protein
MNFEEFPYDKEVYVCNKKGVQLTRTRGGAQTGAKNGAAGPLLIML